MNSEQVQRLASSASRVSKWEKHTYNILKLPWKVKVWGQLSAFNWKEKLQTKAEVQKA